MKREDVLALLAQHQKDLAEFGIRRLALFGSVARNEATTESDIDFLVEFEGEPTFDRYVELNFYLESLLGRSVDLVTVASLRDFMRPTVERDATDVQQCRRNEFLRWEPSAARPSDAKTYACQTLRISAPYDMEWCPQDTRRAAPPAEKFISP